MPGKALANDLIMSKIKLALWIAGFALTACATDSGGVPAPGDDTPPFTNGVSTLSGHADPGYVDGARGTARFANPVNVAYGPDGTLYVADFDNGKIRMVDVDTGKTSTLIAQQNFKRPFAMAFASDGTLYVTTDNDSAGAHTAMTGTIWRVDIHAATAVVIAERIGKPRGLVALPDGGLAISDYQHHVIQLVATTTGTLTPLAGTWDVKGMVNGAGGKFSTPYGMVLRDGKLIVADFDNHVLRQVGLDGTVSTFAGVGEAGFGDGALDAAKFDLPQGVAIAANGDVFVTDLGNYRVRRIRGDAVDTVAGSGEGGYLDSDDRLVAQLYGLEGVSVKPDGSVVFVADGSRGDDVPFNRVRSVKLD